MDFKRKTENLPKPGSKEKINEELVPRKPLRPHLRDSVHFDAQTPPRTPAGPGAEGRYRLDPRASNWKQNRLRSVRGHTRRAWGVGEGRAPLSVSTSGPGKTRPRAFTHQGGVSRIGCCYHIQDSVALQTFGKNWVLSGLKHPGKHMAPFTLLP